MLFLFSLPKTSFIKFLSFSTSFFSFGETLETTGAICFSFSCIRFFTRTFPPNIRSRFLAKSNSAFVFILILPLDFNTFSPPIGCLNIISLLDVVFTISY